MCDLTKGGRAAVLLIATGLLLAGLTSARANDLSGTQTNAPVHQGPEAGEPGGTSDHQTGGGAMGAGPMRGAGPLGGMSMDVDRHYIEWMIPHHDDAVRMAELAPAQSEHADLREFAAHVRQVQTDEIARMREWYQSWYGTSVPINAAIGSAMPMMTGSHDAATPDGARPFDKAFIEQMIPHHEMAVMGSRMAMQRAEHPELLELMESIIASQTAEIALMRDWYERWFGVPVPSTRGMRGHEIVGTMGGHRTDSMHGHQAVGMDGGLMNGGLSIVDRQRMVRDRGSMMMPFDLLQTIHRFETLPDGGLQTVTAIDSRNQAQIALIQGHLSQLAALFQRGDFSSPAILHGAAMPGLDWLSAAGSRLQIVYFATPDGAQIRFTTRDPETVTALHQWFAAQLVDHGVDATDY